MIEAKDLCKIFRRPVNCEDEKKQQKKAKKNKKMEDFFAVNHVGISAYDGEILGILGPNGAGKTTLLRMIGGLLEPTEGRVVIKEKDTDEEITDKLKKKSKIGYLSGNTKLYQRFSSRELMEIFGKVYGLDESELSERIDEISKILDMDEFIDSKISNLSTGQTQKMNIARCLVHNPSIYIFDEPTLGLDIITSESIIDFMKSEKTKGKTIIYSTHYMEEAQYLCDKIVFMYKGEIWDKGTPKQLMDKYGCDNLRDTFKLCINGDKQID